MATVVAEALLGDRLAEATAIVAATVVAAAVAAATSSQPGRLTS